MTDPQDSKDSNLHSGKIGDSQRPIPKDYKAHCRMRVPPLGRDHGSYSLVPASTELGDSAQTGSRETSPREAPGGCGSQGRVLGSWSRQVGSRHAHGAEGPAVADHHLHAEGEEADQRRDWKHIDLYQALVRSNYTQLVASSGLQPAAGSVNVPRHNC